MSENEGHSAEKDAPLAAREPGATYRVVRASKDRRCSDGTASYPMPCPRMIRKGEQYVRAVQFKNHDVYSWIDPVTRKPLTRSMVTDMCFQCAEQYHTTGLLVIDARRRSTRVTPPGKRDDQ
jgi:hypothetical protein